MRVPGNYAFLRRQFYLHAPFPSVLGQIRTRTFRSIVSQEEQHQTRQ